MEPARHAGKLMSAFADARAALDELHSAPTTPPHWWGQVRYRRCAIYFAVLLLGNGFALLSGWNDWRHAHEAGERRASAERIRAVMEGAA